MTKKPKKILVVEDDKILSKAIVQALTDAGFKTDMAFDGKEGIAKMRKSLPDLILLDLLMPRKRGEEVLKAAKRYKNTRNIPVLVLTVVDDMASVANCLKIGAAGYFIKSQYTLGEIVRKVKEKLR